MAEETRDSNIIDDELLRFRIRKVLGESPNKDRWERIYSNPLTPIILTFLLTTIIGSLLTNDLNNKQKRLESTLDRERQTFTQRWEEQKADVDHLWSLQQQNSEQRWKNEQNDLDRRWDALQSGLAFQRTLLQERIGRESNFAIELSRKRVEKIAEVWEKLYIYGAGVDRYVMVFEESDRIEARLAAEQNKGVDASILESYEAKIRASRRESGGIYAYLRPQSEEISALIQKNGFWLGDSSSSKMLRYVDICARLILAAFDNEPEQVKTLKKEKAKAKLDIIQVRKILLRE